MWATRKENNDIAAHVDSTCVAYVGVIYTISFARMARSMILAAIVLGLEVEARNKEYLCALCCH